MGLVQRYVPVVFSLLMFSVIGFLVYMHYPENHFALQYQAAVDCKRTQAVHTIADLAERFYKKQGYYPLANYYSASGDRSLPDAGISVIITNKALPKSYAINPPPEIEGLLVSPGRFKKEVSDVLGIDVELPFDPQTNFAWEKRFYLYKVKPGDRYSVSGVLFSATKYTQKQDDHRHQYQVGSASSQIDKLRVYSSIQNKSVVCASP